MNDNRVVCICSSVTVQDISKSIKKNPNDKIEETQLRLQAGLRCGLCLDGLSPGVEISFFEAYDLVKNIDK